MKSKFKILLLMASILSLSACSEGTEVVSSRYPNGTTMCLEYHKKVDGQDAIVKIVRFYPNGQKQEETELKNGNRHGKSVQWYGNGEKWTFDEYQNGMKHGKSILYYENGKINYEGEFTNGQPSGTWVFYDKTGSMQSERKF